MVGCEKAGGSEMSGNKPTKAAEKRILHLTLKKKWFDMILSGEKKEEYREIKPYWDYRLVSGKYDEVAFRNGYNPDSPWMLIELHGIWKSLGIIKWGAPERKIVYVLRLGRILETRNLGGD